MLFFFLGLCLFHFLLFWTLMLFSGSFSLMLYFLLNFLFIFFYFLLFSFIFKYFEHISRHQMNQFYIKQGLEIICVTSVCFTRAGISHNLVIVPHNLNEASGLDRYKKHILIMSISFFTYAMGWRIVWQNHIAQSQVNR